MQETSILWGPWQVQMPAFLWSVPAFCIPKTAFGNHFPGIVLKMQLLWPPEQLQFKMLHALLEENDRKCAHELPFNFSPPKTWHTVSLLASCWLSHHLRSIASLLLFAALWFAVGLQVWCGLNAASKT